MSSVDRISCPFDPSHVLERRRFQAHLIKCKRTLPVNHDFVQCTFWHLHYVKKSKLLEHLATCEHRLEKEAYRMTWEAEPSKFAEPNLLIDDAINDQSNNFDNCGEEVESWDTVTWPVFRPEKLITDAIHMTVPQGLTKSQRKEFRDRERDRLRELSDKNQNDVVQEEVNQIQEDVTPIPRMPENPVRRPGRIAARFPVPVEQPLETERADLSNVSSTSNQSNPGGILYRGIGRGVLGWNHYN